MARSFSIEITQEKVGQWVRFDIPSTSTGIPTWAVNQVVGAISISPSATGENAQPLVSGGTLIAGSTIYARANTPTTAVANDFFFKQRIALMGSGGGGGGGGTTSYTFSTPLSEAGGNVSLLTRSDLQVSGGSLTLNLNQNTDFRNALLAIDDAKRVATLTEVGRVKPTAGNFTITADGDMALDVSASGVLAQNFAPVAIATEAVKLTNENQNIDGLKTFLKELKAETLVASENGANYGAVDIRNQDGYFSISEDGGAGVAQLLAAAGFIDTTTTFRIRNLAGGVVTFNTLARYESTLTPNDDKDLVPLATLNSVKQELLNRINSLPTGIQWIGEISNTSTEVTTNPTLLTAFVQTQKQRTPQDGDFIRTSDSYGFIYSQNAWVDFGQISISIATTTSAGIMMFGTNDGELQDLGSGKAKVIGWETVKQALQDLDTRINSKATDSDVVKLTGDQTVGGTKTFSGDLIVNGALKAGGRLYFTSASPSISPLTNQSVEISLYNGQVGADCYCNLNFGGKGKILDLKSATLDTDAANLGDVKNYCNGVTGTLTNLTTTAKSTLVAAINELVSAKAGLSSDNAFTGNNTVPTPTGDQSIANKAYVDSNKSKIFSATQTITASDLPAGLLGAKKAQIP